MKNLIILILLLPVFKSFGCDCNYIPKEVEFQESNFIFIGKVISVESNFIVVKGQESFKGKLIDNIKIKIDYCSISPLKGELWLFYMTKTNNQYFVSSCGNSRSFNKPFLNNGLSIPPPSKNILNNEILEIMDDLYFKNASIELKTDILDLRLIKTKNYLNTVDSHNKNLKSQIKYIKGCVLFIVSIAIIFFAYKKIIK